MSNFVSWIDRQKSNFLMQTMAHQVEDDASPAHSGEGHSESSEWSSFIPVLMHFVSARMRTPYLSAVPMAPFLSLTLIAQGAR
jgi:hypothetical protein